MAKAVNVILQKRLSDGSYSEIDLNAKGLISMKFDRYLGNNYNLKDEILSQLDIIIFDRTGFELLSMLQANSSNIRLKYGFEDNLSKLYILTFNKLNATYNNLGITVSMSGFGTNIKRVFPPEIYTRGTSVYDILEMMANRNGWDIGPENINIIDAKNLQLSYPLYKEPKETDYNFIYNKILPMVELNVFVPDLISVEDINNFYTAKLFLNGTKPEFYFTFLNSRGTKQRVWDYSYGASTTSLVSDFTHSLDYSFLIKGLTIQVPMLSDSNDPETDIQNTIKSSWDNIDKILASYNIPRVDPDQFKFNIEIVEQENIGNADLATRVANAIKNAVMAISTIKLTVIGNPDILPTDLVRLTIKNNDDVVNPIISGLWRIVWISEEVGLQGYKTILNLVREVPNVNNI